MTTMKAISIKDSKGPATSLFMSEISTISSPGTNEAVVKVAAFALNRMDILQREGLYNVPPQAPVTLGVEFSGTITAIGESESEFQVGDKVFGLASGGAYAEYILCPIPLLIKYVEPAAVDSPLTFIASAGVPEVWFTACQALLTIADIQSVKPKSVLIHAGASGVGIACLQLARSLLGKDAILFATVGSDEKVKFVESVPGASFGINYRKYDYVKFISDKTGGTGVDVVVDFIGADYFARNIAVAARDGRIVMLSLMSGAIVDKVNIGLILAKRLRIEGSTLRSRTVEYQTKLRNQVAEFVLPRLQSGEFVNPVDKVFSWKDIVKAHQYMESNMSMGKIICVID
ncbi:hypothetical protein V1512DRAFT_268172 [Lipomyces arxii]|uniref:uncharacterized protein n=1 Tax=Lipomyces arxii TaxID=56418 RepID=UPI0034CFF86D